MNQQQILSLVRMLLTLIGTALAAKGIIAPGTLTSTVDILMTAIGAVAVAGSTIWGLWRNTHANTIAAAASLDSVTKIVTDTKTAAVVPSDKVVPPGS